MTSYLMAHGASDPAAATAKAVVSLGNAVNRQALVMGFSDAFAVVGILLGIAAASMLLARRPKAATGAGAH